MKSTLYKSSIKNINSLFRNKYLLFTIIAIILVGIMYVYKENIIEGLRLSPPPTVLSDAQKTFIKSTINLDSNTTTNQKKIEILKIFFNNQTPPIINTPYNKIISSPYYNKNKTIYDLLYPPTSYVRVTKNWLGQRSYRTIPLVVTEEQTTRANNLLAEENNVGYVNYNNQWYFRDDERKLFAIKQIDNGIETIQILATKEQPTNVAV
jgi:hypothetical protein